MKIPFATMDRMHADIREEMLEAFARVYDKGQFIQGDECSAFENEFANYCGSRFAVGVASGLDAITLALRALGIGSGDDVIVPANTFIATALAVSSCGANLVLADPDEASFNMSLATFKEALTPNTKAVIPVHLYGQAAEIAEIVDFARSRGILVIEDCAQAHGARYRGKHVGTFGDAGCFSFYPGKNLGALGDGGAIISDNSEIASYARMLANYGSEIKYHHIVKGVNSRLDEVQAALLRIKLRHLDEYNAERGRIAKSYLEGIKNPLITLPTIGPERNHVWHIFAIRCNHRKALKEHLEQSGIGVNCHYPITIAHQAAYHGDGLNASRLANQLANEVLSLPLYAQMTSDEIEHVISCVNMFDLR